MLEKKKFQNNYFEFLFWLISLTILRSKICAVHSSRQAGRNEDVVVSLWGHHTIPGDIHQWLCAASSLFIPSIHTDFLPIKNCPRLQKKLSSYSILVQKWDGKVGSLLNVTEDWLVDATQRNTSYHLVIRGEKMSMRKENRMLVVFQERLDKGWIAVSHKWHASGHW